MFTRKTKDQNILKAIWVPLVILPTFLVVLSIAGPKPAFYLLGGIYLFLSLFPFLTFWRTQNNGFLAVTMFMIFAGLVCVSAPPAFDDKSKIGLIPLFVVGMYVWTMGNSHSHVGGKKKRR